MTAASPPPRRAPAEQQRLETMLREVFESRIHFHQFLGLKVDSLDPANTRMSFAMRPELVGNALVGRLHGGMISATLDAVGALAIATAIAEKHGDEAAEQLGHRLGRVGTIDLRVDYLRPGTGKRFVAGGRVTRLGGRIASVQMTLEDDHGQLVATGAAAYVVS